MSSDHAARCDDTTEQTVTINNDGRNPCDRAPYVAQPYSVPPVLVHVSTVRYQRPLPLHSRLNHEKDDVQGQLRGSVWYVRSSRSASDNRSVRLLESYLNAQQSLAGTAHTAVNVWWHIIMYVYRPWCRRESRCDC
jgi:hypothetical protein